MRVLRNLHGVYSDGEDWERATRSADRLLKLSPNDPDALRDRGLGYLHMGHASGARTDLARYLQLNPNARSEEHTSELQSLMRISYAVLCLKKTKTTQNATHKTNSTEDRIS